MPRKSTFSWNDDNKKQLKQVVSNFNKKLTRLKKSNPSIKSSLPEKVKYSEIKELIGTKGEFNKNVKRLKRFLKPNAEKLITVPETRENIQITKWQYDEINRLVKDVNKNRLNRWNQLEKIKLKSGKNALNYTRGQLGMGTTLQNSLKPTTAFSPSMENYNVRKRYKSLLEQSTSQFFKNSDLLLKRNYINTLKENYGKYANEIAKEIEDMSINRFLSIYYEQDNAFEWLYPGDNFLEYVNQVRATWGLKSLENSETIKLENIRKKSKK